MRLETISDFLGLHMESFKILDILFFNILNPFIVKKNMHGKMLRVFKISWCLQHDTKEIKLKSSLSC